VAAPQENTTVMLAVIVAAIAARLPAGSSVLPTLVAALGVTSLATGALLIAAGRFRLGKMMRFLPFPVVAGFLAGTGWLLVQERCANSSSGTLFPLTFVAGP
jgi:SulP family sulfate permease